MTLGEYTDTVTEIARYLPELEIPDEISCPYCQSFCADKNVLSRHIDDIHIGKGLLEGNITKATI